MRLEVVDLNPVDLHSQLNRLAEEIMSALRPARECTRLPA
jgi:hypothetical protein